MSTVGSKRKLEEVGLPTQDQNGSDKKKHRLGNKYKIDKVAIMGGGQFGFALAYLLSTKHPSLHVHVYDPVEKIVAALQNDRSHPYFHKGVTLGDGVIASLDQKSVVSDADLVILAVPGKFMRACVKQIVGYLKHDCILLSLAKALEPESNKFMSEVLKEVVDETENEANIHIAALAGGMLAEEVTCGFPIAADLGSSNFEVADAVGRLLQTEMFKINVTTDVDGLELAGCLKNVIAIGAGFLDGLGYQASSKAAYLSTAAAQMRRFAGTHDTVNALDTFDLGSFAWLGDLLTTCFGDGRNRLFGSYIGEGDTVEVALKKLTDSHKISEGYLSAKGFAQVARQKGLDDQLPILMAINAVLFEGLDVREGIKRFFR